MKRWDAVSCGGLRWDAVSCLAGEDVAHIRGHLGHGIPNGQKLIIFELLTMATETAETASTFLLSKKRRGDGFSGQRIV